MSGDGTIVDRLFGRLIEALDTIGTINEEEVEHDGE